MTGLETLSAGSTMYYYPSFTQGTFQLSDNESLFEEIFFFCASPVFSIEGTCNTDLGDNGGVTFIVTSDDGGGSSSYGFYGDYTVVDEDNNEVVAGTSVTSNGSSEIVIDVPFVSVASDRSLTLTYNQFGTPLPSSTVACDPPEIDYNFAIELTCVDTGPSFLVQNQLDISRRSNLHPVSISDDTEIGERGV